MSTSLLYHAFGARNYRYLRTEYLGGAIFLHAEKKDRCRRCRACGSRNTVGEGRAIYPIRTLPIGLKPVFLVLHLRVLGCRACGAVVQEARDVADARKSYTRPFARYVLALARQMTMAAIARYLKVGWDLVKSIIQQELERRARRRSWRKVRRISIDEVAIRKGQRYMTVVLDLDTGVVLYTAEGRDHECLRPFFRRLRLARAKLQAVAVDMSSAYRKAIEDFAPKDVVVVHDRYHLVANMNDVLDKVRRDEQRRLEGEGKKVIKGSRYLLLRAQDKLAQMPAQQARLDALLAINRTLHKAYLLKEDLRLFWSQRSKDDAKLFIVQWVELARLVASRHLRRFARTVSEHLDDIVSWYDHPISNGPIEGTINKIKVLKRAAYGYRDPAFFGLRILFIHEATMDLTAL